MKFLRLYQSDKGIWRYEIERNGKVYWTSLRTRSRTKAERDYRRMKQWLIDWEKEQCR
jgi:hypothetical protein